MSTWFGQILSIDETKASALVISLLLAIVFGLVMYYTSGDITDNMLVLLQTLIIAVGGTTSAGVISNLFTKKSTDSEDKTDVVS